MAVDALIAATLVNVLHVTEMASYKIAMPTAGHFLGMCLAAPPANLIRKRQQNLVLLSSFINAMEKQTKVWYYTIKVILLEAFYGKHCSCSDNCRRRASI